MERDEIQCYIKLETTPGYYVYFTQCMSVSDTLTGGLLDPENFDLLTRVEEFVNGSSIDYQPFHIA